MIHNTYDHVCSQTPHPDATRSFGLLSIDRLDWVTHRLIWRPIQNPTAFGQRGTRQTLEVCRTWQRMVSWMISVQDMYKNSTSDFLARVCLTTLSTPTLDAQRSKSRACHTVWNPKHTHGLVKYYTCLLCVYGNQGKTYERLNWFWGHQCDMSTLVGDGSRTSPFCHGIFCNACNSFSKYGSVWGSNGCNWLCKTGWSDV